MNDIINVCRLVLGPPLILGVLCGVFMLIRTAVFLRGSIRAKGTLECIVSEGSDFPARLIFRYEYDGRIFDGYQQEWVITKTPGHYAPGQPDDIYLRRSDPSAFASGGGIRATLRHYAAQTLILTPLIALII